MIIKILDRAAMGFDLSFDCLSQFGNAEIYDNTSQNELFERIENAEVLVLNKVKMTREAISKAKNLKLICVFATGYDNIDLSAAKDFGVAVCNVPAYSTDSVTLFTISTALYLYTHLGEYRSYVNSGKYSEGKKANCLTPIYHELKDKKWGIIGFGNIGKSVAKVAQALGAEILVCKRIPVSDYNCVDIDTLCAESDIITIHCPLNDSTRCLINRERIELMKKSVIIVNEARGAVTDEAAIADALLEGRIAAFGSDVYSEEPFDKKHPFAKILELDNVCLTPHSAWGAYEARERCLNVIFDNIRCFINREIKNRVDI